MKLYLKTLLCATLGAVALLAVSCYDDEGNYHYKTLDEITIDTAGLGIQSSYAINTLDTIWAEPIVLFNGDTVNGHEDIYPLEFLWTIYAASTGTGVDYTVDTLGSHIPLVAPISKASGTYTIRLTVTNTKDGIETYLTLGCTTTDNIGDGWMVLYESKTNPGCSDVALIVNDLVKNYYYSADKVQADLYSIANGEPLDGNPVAICHSCAVGLANSDGAYPEVIIQTDKDMVGVGSASFIKQLSFEDFFYSPPATCAPEAFVPQPLRFETVINDNKVYHANFSSSSYRDQYYGVAYSGEYGKLAPWSATFIAYNYDAVVYDTEAQKFINVPYSNVTFGGWAEQDMDIAAFDVNDVGMEMIASDYGYNGYEYSLMHGGSSYMLLVSDFYNSDITTEYVGIAKYDITNSPEIADMVSMSCGRQGELLFYASKDNVYCLKYIDSDIADLLYSAPAGEEITCIRVHKYFYPSITEVGFMPGYCKILHVATYNESTGEGKLYMLPIDSSNGEITDEIREYSGFGKILDMGWKVALS